MNLFRHIKAHVTAREAAERYGLMPNHSGMCLCPFHDDRSPSMKVDTRYFCFGCHETGDVIDLTARLFGLSLPAAAEKLAADFALTVEEHAASTGQERKTHAGTKQTLALARCYHVLCDYKHLLAKWRSQYEPQTPAEEWHPLFVEAVSKTAELENALDELLYGTPAEQERVLREYEPKLPLIQEKTKEWAVRLPARKSLYTWEDGTMKQNEEMVRHTPVYPHSIEHARERGELEQFRASHQALLACKSAIEAAISHHFDGMHLERLAVTDVLKRFGSQRVTIVLAATIQDKHWDGRFSASNKQWAESVSLPDSILGNDRRSNYVVVSHPTVLNGYVNIARKEMEHEQRHSVHSNLNQTGTTPTKVAAVRLINQAVR